MDSATKCNEAFFDLCDHLLDQGFMEGDNNVSLNGFDFAPVFTDAGGNWRRLDVCGDMLIASARVRPAGLAATC